MGPKTSEALSNINGLYHTMNLSKCHLSLVPQIAGLVSLVMPYQLYVSYHSSPLRKTELLKKVNFYNFLWNRLALSSPGTRCVRWPTRTCKTCLENPAAGTLMGIRIKHRTGLFSLDKFQRGPCSWHYRDKEEFSRHFLFPYEFFCMLGCLPLCLCNSDSVLNDTLTDCKTRCWHLLVFYIFKTMSFM